MIPSPRRARAGLFAAFASLGVTAAFVPALLPAAEQRLDAPLSIAVPALFAGLLVGVLLSGPLLVRRPTRMTLLIGTGLQSVALVAVALAPAPTIFIAAAAVAGLGFGLVEAAGSVAAKAAAVGSATGLLSALLGTVAVCAALTPLAVAAGAAVPAALSILAAVPLTAVVLLAGSAPRSISAAPERRDLRGLRMLLPFALALPLYVGVETVLSGWSAVIPGRALTLDPAAAALGTSVFWALMALGRFGAAALRRGSVSPVSILAVGTVGAACLMTTAGVTVSDAPIIALLALAAAVVLLAPSYGLILGLALDRLDAARGAAVTGALVACGAVGGTFVPALVLVVGRDPASSTTLLMSAGLCALVAVIVVGAVRTRRASSSPR